MWDIMPSVRASRGGGFPGGFEVCRRIAGLLRGADLLLDELAQGLTARAQQVGETGFHDRSGEKRAPHGRLEARLVAQRQQLGKQHAQQAL